jgi:hypothetical protein
MLIGSAPRAGCVGQYDTVAGSLSLVALVMMLLSIQASRRMARARALSFGQTEEPKAL